MTTFSQHAEASSAFRKESLGLGSPLQVKDSPSSVQVCSLFPCRSKVFSFSDKQPEVKLSVTKARSSSHFPPHILVFLSLASSFAALLITTERCQCWPTEKGIRLLISCATPRHYFLETKTSQLCKTCAGGTSTRSNCLVNLPDSVCGYHLTSRTLL